MDTAFALCDVDTALTLSIRFCSSFVALSFFMFGASCFLLDLKRSDGTDGAHTCARFQCMFENEYQMPKKDQKRRLLSASHKKSFPAVVQQVSNLPGF